MGVQLSGMVSNEGCKQLNAFLLWYSKTSHTQLVLVNKTCYFEKKLILLSPAAPLKATLRGKYFIHNGKYVVSSRRPSQHGVVVPYSFAVDTPMAPGH